MMGQMAREDLHLPLMVPELESFTAWTVPAPPHSPAASFTSDMLCVTLCMKKFYFLNTQKHPHIKVANVLVWH